MADVSWASVKPPLKSLKGSTKPGQLQSHGIFDHYWKQPGLYAEGFYDRYADVPIVHLSGWYDPYARTAMENYVGLSRAKRSRMQLVLGP